MEKIKGIDLKKLVEECEAEFEEERPLREVQRDKYKLFMKIWEEERPLREAQRDKHKLFMKKWEEEPPCPWMRPY